MPFAPNYNPTKDFSQDEAVNATGRSTVNTSALDAELANVEQSVNAINDNLQVIQRDDNELRDFLIKPRMLSDATRALISGGWNPRGTWQAGVPYAVRDFVEHGGMCYVCCVAHTANSFAVEASFWLGVSSVADVVLLTERAETAAVHAENFANSAQGSANAAATSATNAANSAASIAGSVSAAANSALIAGQHKDDAAASAANAAASASQADASKTAAQNAAQTAASSAATQTATQITQAMQGYVTSAASSATQSANSATQSAEARDAAVAAANSVSPADLVHKSGVETITGQKTFVTPPIGAHIPGQMVATFADTPPPRTLVCNGGVVSRTLYAALFAAIGTKYGAGDGVTTFNLPNVLPSHALIAANGAGEVGTTSPGDIKSHNHGGSIGQNGDHAHTINYLVGVVSNQSTGQVMMAGGGAAQWTSTQGNHSHSISIAAAGGSYNYAAGMRLLICIAY